MDKIAGNGINTGMGNDLTELLPSGIPSGMTATGWIRHLTEIAPSVSDRIVAMEQAACAKYLAAQEAMYQARAEFHAALVEAEMVAAKHWTKAEIVTAKTRHVADGDSETVCQWCNGDARACYPRFLAGRSCA